MCGSKSYLWNQNVWVPMQSSWAAPGSGSAGGMITRNTYTQGKGELEWVTWPIRLVLKLSLQSENETNDPLKSGPALARPAGPETPRRLWSTHIILKVYCNAWYETIHQESAMFIITSLCTYFIRRTGEYNKSYICTVML